MADVQWLEVAKAAAGILGTTVGGGWLVAKFVFKAGQESTNLELALKGLRDDMREFSDSNEKGHEAITDTVTKAVDVVDQKLERMRENTDREFSDLKKTFRAERSERLKADDRLTEKVDRLGQKQDVAHAYQRHHSERNIPRVP